MANFNRDIVATRKLASKGRYGDNMIREVDNEPSHVNAYEAQIIDKYGKSGEEAVQDIGAGTINPSTGMKEYHLWHKHGSHIKLPKIGGWVGDIWDNTVGVKGVAGAVGDILYEGDWDAAGDKLKNTVSGVWDYTIGKYGLMDALGGGKKRKEQRALEAGAKKAVSGGLESIEGQIEDYLGPEGFLSGQREDEVHALSKDYEKSLTGISKIASQTGVSSSGELRELKKDTTSQLLSGVDKIDRGFRKSESDLMTTLRDKMSSLVLEYQSATDEPYPGGEAETNLSQLFSDYFSDDEDV